MFIWAEADGAGNCLLHGLLVGSYMDWSERTYTIMNGGPMSPKRFYWNSPDAVSVAAHVEDRKGNAVKLGNARVSCVGAAKAWVEQRVRAWVDENLERDAA